jgi:hypothetical protein
MLTRDRTVHDAGALADAGPCATLSVGDPGSPDLARFLTEHRLCGELGGGVDDVTVWLACECGQESSAVLTNATLLT